jgi:acyl-CoA synthetase (AMP-forming)/AMP-acid ligase II
MARAELLDVVTTADRRRRYLAEGWWDSSTLAGRVREHAREAPDAVAVVDDLGRYRYGQLADDAAAVAAGLGERGVVTGSVVALQLPNRYEAVVAAVAVQSLGAVINPLLPNYRARELTTVFTTAAPAVVVTPGEFRGFDHRGLIADVVAGTGVDACHVVVGADPGPNAEPFEALLRTGASELGDGWADRVSELIFTSGTEARPKAIMHTEQTANFSVRVAHADLGLGDGDVVWMPSPIGHSTGFNYGVRLALYHRLRLVLQDRWDGDTALSLMSREKGSYTLAATTFLQDLTEAAMRGGARVDSLRCFGCGGAPVPPKLVDDALACGIHALRLYGSTEVLVGTWNRPWSSPDRRRLTDGVAMSHVEIEVRDDKGAPVAPGTAGELFVRGPNTCVGFFDDPERTAATFGPDGWVRSGDICTIDDGGYLTVVGRKKEIIIRGGLNIAPREIEELLVSFPEVERAAVVGLPDARLGERMCACVVLRPGADLDFETTVQRLRAAGLATYKLPERLEVLGALPSTASGKVQKHEIVEALVDRGPEASGEPGTVRGAQATGETTGDATIGPE